MRRALLVGAVLMGLAGCAGGGAEGNPWYQIGDANYDAVKAQADACKAKGGTFQLKDGGDPTHLGDYECAMPKKGT